MNGDDYRLTDLQLKSVAWSGKTSPPKWLLTRRLIINSGKAEFSPPTTFGLRMHRVYPNRETSLHRQHGTQMSHETKNNGGVSAAK